MYLKELVGKMAIRTMEPVNPFDPLCVINDGLRGKIWSPTFGGRGVKRIHGRTIKDCQRRR